MPKRPEKMLPLLYEINTRCWLRELSEESGSSVTLGDVTLKQFEEWRNYGFTHIWLMGAWSTGPLARAQALAHSSLRQSYSEAVPDWAEEDVAGSPYAIADYRISRTLGGDEGLEKFRARLHQHEMKLLLDFVPNHLGVDHSWLSSEPDLFVQSPVSAPETFAQKTELGTFWLAHGKDPYFAAWSDTVQIDYRREQTQIAMVKLLRSLAERCDGVRCDMAMLLLKDVFVKTWERFPSSSTASASEFWQAAIPAIKSEHPDFLFLAEAYWGTESRLLSLGFDYTYDKTLYDRLVNRDARGVQEHLFGSGLELIKRSAHFLENHDEPRIASILTPAEHRAAALLILALPGMRFLHQGQLTGARRRVPVQLGRCGRDVPLVDIEAMYDQMLTVLKGTDVGDGKAELLRPLPAWAENPTAQNFIVIQWQGENFPKGNFRASNAGTAVTGFSPSPLHGERPSGADAEAHRTVPDFTLAVVNLAPHPSQCYVRPTVTELAAHRWSMKDLLGAQQFERPGQELKEHGLYLDLPAHGAQLFHFKPI